MNTFSSLRSFTVPSGCGESESRRIGPDNKPLQTDERRVLVMAELHLILAPLAAERQSR